MNDEFDRTPEDIDKNSKINPSDGNSSAPRGRLIKDRKFRIGLIAFIVALALVLSVVTTFALTKRHYEKKIVEAYLDVLSKGDNQLGKLDEYFRKYSYYDLNSEELIEKALRAYVAATGDRYARYYNKEEYAEYLESSRGVSGGIGINVEYAESESAIRVTRVLDGSPADKAGLLVGDLIYMVSVADGTSSLVADLGYEAALASLRKNVGDTVVFSVKRYDDYGVAYERFDFSITLESYSSDTVDYRVCSTDASVGIILITKFDLLTPVLFKEAMEALADKGVSKIIFDIRDNPGGDLASILAVLSYFRNDGETILSVKTRGGEETVYKSQVRYYNEDAKSCTVTRDEVGMYKNGSYAVLINGGTASAAELFASNFRDASLGVLVGTKTFGKGILQTTYPFGEGGVKLTTKSYFPPCGISYDGIGILPSGEECVLSDEAQSVNPYIRDDAIDNQLQAAIAALNK